MNLMFIPIVTWGEAKAALDAGRKAYYLDGGDFWDLMIVDDPIVTTQIMKAGSFTAFPAEVTRYFSQEQSADFETNYLPKLLKSSIGQGA